MSGIFLCICSYSDIRYRKINLITCIVFAFIGVCIKGFGLDLNFLDIAFRLLPGLLMLFVAFITNEKIGYGDPAMIITIALIHESDNLYNLILTSFFILFCISALLWIVKGKKEYQVPFAPVLFVSNLILILGTI